MVTQNSIDPGSNPGRTCFLFFFGSRQVQELFGMVAYEVRICWNLAFIA